MVASLVLWHGMKYAILENLFTTTNMEPLPLIGRGNSKKKFIDISTQSSLVWENEFITYEVRL